MTIQNRIAKALLARGEKEITRGNDHYRKFTRTFQGVSCGFYFVGKAGALRVGKTVSSSCSMLPAAKARLLAEATERIVVFEPERDL
jgi:hypothetical protein